MHPRPHHGSEGELVCLPGFVFNLCFQDGKYLIVKDPNKPILRLYDIPDGTFESEEESGESEEGEQ